MYKRQEREQFDGFVNKSPFDAEQEDSGLEETNSEVDAETFDLDYFLSLIHISTEKIIVSGVLTHNLRPTAVFDSAATEKARIQAREETPPHVVTIVEGQTIVSEGEIVSENDILILSNLGLLNTGFNWKAFLYICFINLVTFSIFYFYLFKFNKNIFDNMRKLWIASTIIIIFIALIKIFTTLSNLHLNFWVYLFPIMAASMLGTVIFDTRVGIILSIILAVNLGIAANFDYQMALIYFLGGIFRCV